MFGDLCLILDLGFPDVQLLAHRVRRQGVYAKVVTAPINTAQLLRFKPRAVILAGPASYDAADLREMGIPLLAAEHVDEFTDRREGGATRPSGVLSEFLFEIAGFDGDWSIGAFIEESVAQIRSQVGDARVVLGLSGGVDSLVTAALMHRAVGDRLACVLIDNGFLRAGERESVEAVFGGTFAAQLRVVDARQRFLDALSGAAPESKRRLIHREFLAIFEQEAARIPEARFLARGIISSDLPALSRSSPRSTVLEPIEPLRDLVKEEVRELGSLLGLPRDLLRRQPFPGAGLAVRCVGQVTEHRLAMLRAADQILGEEIDHAGMPPQVFQSFAVLLPVPSPTTASGHDATGETVCLRVVESGDGTVADWLLLPADLLKTISTRLMTEIPGVSRVVYDITTKPPGRIEWE
ncbi:MAG TPA: hypothetical protein VGS19_22615 [Streptosporangiaceae bacterium]|nr:hypothetical protein [Streptosporangiaceae bacterium]